MPRYVRMSTSILPPSARESSSTTPSSGLTVPPTRLAEGSTSISSRFRVIRKAKSAIQAAYAVGEPSGADLRVAAEAYQLEAAAQKDLEREQEAGGVHTWYA
jgi:hypothetical protein